MQYNQDCSTYSIHMLYSMMRLREKKYKLKDLGYVPIYLSMEYMRNHDFIACFNTILFDFIYGHRFRYENHRRAKLYNEEIYINHETVSGIDIRLVEPIDFFKIYVGNISSFRNVFCLVELLMHLDFGCCLDYLFEKFKEYTKNEIYAGCRCVSGSRSRIGGNGSKNHIIYEIKKCIFERGNKMFMESFNKYFSTP